MDRRHVISRLRFAL